MLVGLGIAMVSDQKDAEYNLFALTSTSKTVAIPISPTVLQGVALLKSGTEIISNLSSKHAYTCLNWFIFHDVCRPSVFVYKRCQGVRRWARTILSGPSNGMWCPGTTLNVQRLLKWPVYQTSKFLCCYNVFYMVIINYERLLKLDVLMIYRWN